MSGYEPCVCSVWLSSIFEPAESPAETVSVIARPRREWCRISWAAPFNDAPSPIPPKFIRVLSTDRILVAAFSNGRHVPPRAGEELAVASPVAIQRLARTLAGAVGSAEAGRVSAVIRLLTDENLDGRIVRGVEMHHPEIDLLRTQETGAFEQEDDIVLALAAREERVLLTHDIATIPTFAANRIAAGEPMPAVLIVASQGRIAAIIFEVALFTICTEPAEVRDRIVYLRVP